MRDANQTAKRTAETDHALCCLQISHTRERNHQITHVGDRLPLRSIAPPASTLALEDHN